MFFKNLGSKILATLGQLDKLRLFKDKCYKTPSLMALSIIASWHLSTFAFAERYTWVDGRFYVDTPLRSIQSITKSQNTLNPKTVDGNDEFAPQMELSQDAQDALDLDEHLSGIKTQSTDSSRLYGDMVVSFYQDDLPYGSQIEILYGLGGVEDNGQGLPNPISWEKSGSVNAQAIGPYVWSANIARSITQFDGLRSYSKLQFCVRVTLPNGEKYHVEHCMPPTLHLEAEIPWSSVPPVAKQEADWRRLPLNHTHSKPK